MTLKSSWRHGVQSMSCQNLPWRHDVQNISWRQKVRQKYVRTSESSPWRQNIRHDVNTRHDDKMLVITSKGLSKRRHHVKTIHGIKNTPNICHEVKNTSWCQKFVMKLKIHHDVKQFIVTSKSSSLYPKKTSRRPRVSNDYEFSKTLVTNIRPIPVIFLDNFGIIPRYVRI